MLKFGVYSHAKVGIPDSKILENPLRKSRRKNCANVGSANRKREKNYVRLQRNIIPVQKHATDKKATSEPHDEMAPQKISEIMDSGWTIIRNGFDENKKTTNIWQKRYREKLNCHPRSSPNDTSSPRSLQVHR